MAHIKSLLERRIFRTLIINGKNIGVIKKVQSELAAITPKLNLKPPFSCPNSRPKNKKVRYANAEAAAIKDTKASGLSVKSPIVSRLIENKYPMKVIANAHCPNGVTADGAKSKIKPPINPNTRAPVRSSNESKTSKAAT